MIFPLEVDCPESDVMVTKTASATTVGAGLPILYLLTVTNLGPDLANDVELTDSLVGLTPWSVGGPDGDDCTITDTGLSTDELSCDFGELGVGATRTVALSRGTLPIECGPAPYLNVATVSASNEAPGTDGNNASAVVVALACPDVTISKAAVDSTIDLGDEIVYSITATDLGPGFAVEVMVTDSLVLAPFVVGPWAVDPLAAGTCTIVETGTIPPREELSCDLGDLSAGEAVTVTVRAPTGPVCPGAPFANQAFVSASNEAAGADGNNASGLEVVTVACP